MESREVHVVDATNVRHIKQIEYFSDTLDVEMLAKAKCLRQSQVERLERITESQVISDEWQTAGDWAPAALLAAPVATVNRIKAVRLGIVVRSEQFDSEYLVPAPWSMFDGQVSGSILASKSPPGNWRLRTYETIIPLRNAIWNRMT